MKHKSIGMNYQYVYPIRKWYSKNKFIVNIIFAIWPQPKRSVASARECPSNAECVGFSAVTPTEKQLKYFNTGIDFAFSRRYIS